MSKRLIVSIVAGLALFVGGAGAAYADPSVGNSGHSNNGSSQCKAGGNDHCPPFGP